MTHSEQMKYSCKVTNGKPSLWKREYFGLRWYLWLGIGYIVVLMFLAK